LKHPIYLTMSRSNSLPVTGSIFGCFGIRQYRPSYNSIAPGSGPSITRGALKPNRNLKRHNFMYNSLYVRWRREKRFVYSQIYCPLLSLLTEGVIHIHKSLCLRPYSDTARSTVLYQFHSSQIEREVRLPVHQVFLPIG
jgi:hypothetical protein